MGMYTEIHVAGSCPVNHRVAPILKYLFGDGERPANLPSHSFFHCERWDCIGNMSSFYLSPIALRACEVRLGRDLHFHSVSNLKNYDGEIEKFFDWLSREGISFYGHSRYEEDLATVVTYCSKDNL